MRFLAAASFQFYLRQQYFAGGVICLLSFNAGSSINKLNAIYEEVNLMADASNDSAAAYKLNSI